MSDPSNNAINEIGNIISQLGADISQNIISPNLNDASLNSIVNQFLGVLLAESFPITRPFPTEDDPRFESFQNLIINPRSGQELMPNPSRLGSNRIISRSLERFINETLNAKPRYKKVLSAKGSEQLKQIQFSNELNTNTSCPISQDEFKEGETITILPCNHIFTPQHIDRWLKTEKALCPVCRCELDSEEIKADKILIEEIAPAPSENEEQERLSAEENSAQIRNGRQNLIQSLNRTYRPLRNIFSSGSQPPNSPTDLPPWDNIRLPPPSYVVQQLVDDNNTDIQEALLASMSLDTSNNIMTDTSNNMMD